MKLKVLVTGGAGFIGSHQVDALIKSGYEVVVVDDLSSGSKKNVNSKAKFYKIDIRSEKLANVFEKEKPKAVFHFAAQISVNYSVKNPVADAEINILGALNVLKNCADFDVQKIVFSSTGGAMYTNPKKVPTPETSPVTLGAPYAIAKYTIERYIEFFHKQSGLEYAIMRYANVYGPRQDTKGEAGVIALFINKMLRKEQPFIHGTGRQTRDFVFVGDVIRANILAFKSKKSNIYHVSSGKQTTINEIFDTIKENLNSTLEKKYKDEFSGPDVSCLSYGKIKRALGWDPKMELEKGIGKTIAFFREQRT